MATESDNGVELVDADARARALNADESFIVQAPAGSGKTELLTRRILKLLTVVERPEEILAITFTRKAASEMRHRVISELHVAAQESAADLPPHKHESFALARTVLLRSQQLDWQLLQDPSRLSIRTIDSLCMHLTQQMPVLSAFGATPATLDDAGELYRKAAAGCIEHQFEPDAVAGSALRNLLDRRDNNVEGLQQLLASMLATRDQWLRHCGNNSLQQEVSAALLELVSERFEALAASLPEIINDSIIALVQHAARCHAQLNASTDLVALLESDTVPLPTRENGLWWRTLRQLVLKKDSKELRRSADKRCGFPTAKKDAEALGIEQAELRELKQRFVELLQQLEAETEFIDLLVETSALPLNDYNESEWALLSDLFTLCIHAVAELQLVFAEVGQVDFTEIAMRACRSLGQAEDPTDLALVLDYRISHILVDEFQDTSLSQFQLFEKLVAGWQPGDGKTFFAVGDPMQSIYLFRNAEVGLFLQAAASGVGAVPLTPLQLSANFRSAPALVNWCNDTFTRIFPQRADSRSGSIVFSASSASASIADQSGCTLHPILNDDGRDQACRIADLIDTRIASGDESIAVLARSKSVLGDIFQILQEREIAYQAVDIETLGDRPVVRDIVAMLRALLHPLDRLHWLAVLRAPWCALSLSDLHALLADEPKRPVWSLINDEDCLGRLPASARQRVENLTEVLSPAVLRHPRDGVMHWLEACWRLLGGDLLLSEADIKAADVCFAELLQLERQGKLYQSGEIDRRMQNLMAPISGDAKSVVQIMTIHKSKGLEFDTVILPSLSRPPRADQQQLLNWFEYRNENNVSRLLLAPMREKGQKLEAGTINKLVSEQRRQKQRNEMLRLLYVAATRAKKSLHLFAGVTFKNGNMVAPNINSLVYPLWPVVRSQFETVQAPDEHKETQVCTEQTAPRLLRWLDIPPDSAWKSLWCRKQTVDVGAIDVDEIEFRWAGTDARHIGTVVHQQLQRIAETGMTTLEIDNGAQTRSLIHQQLLQLGVADAVLERAVERVFVAVSNVLRDDTGCWLLSNHAEAANELRVSGLLDGRVINGVIDRTFVDRDEVRWIIDYKTGEHRGGQIDEFLDREQDRYQLQLERYARIMQHLDQRSIRLGLYFPMLCKFRHWQPDLQSQTITITS